MVDHQTRTRLVLNREKIKFPAQLPVVPLASLLEHVEIVFQSLRLRKRRPVNPLENLVPCIPPPVRSGNIEKLDGLDPCRGRKMRAFTQIQKASLTVEGNVVRKFFQMFHLIRFTHLSKRLG